MSIEPINPNAILIRTSKGNILITHEIESILEIKIYSSCIKNYLESIIHPHCALIDGELILRNNKSFNAIQSAVMTEIGKPDFIYKVFDCIPQWNQNNYYQNRVSEIGKYIKELGFIQFLNS